MSAYMLVSYWMDAEGWTMLRRCLMFANVPMVIFFGAPARKPATAACPPPRRALMAPSARAGLMLSGQTQFHTFGLSCKVQGFILQVTYLQMNMWHTMTVIILHRVITTGSPKFH